MLKIDEKFTNFNAADSDYPNGSYKNDTIAGDKTGTAVDAASFNDALGFSEALMAEAGIEPSGNPDTATSSDRLDAMKAVFVEQTNTGTAAAYDVTTSTTDTSTGGNGQPRVMRVGDGGAILPIPFSSASPLSGLGQHSATYYVSNGTDLPVPKNGTLMHARHTLNQKTQLYLASDGTLHYRADNGTILTPWQEILHTGNTGSIVTEDYEEGTWTPAVDTGATLVSIDETGRYRKIGDTVVATAVLTIQKSGAGTSFNVTSLPFVSNGVGACQTYNAGAALSPYLPLLNGAVVASSSYSFLNFSSSIPDATTFQVGVRFEYITN